MGKTETPTQTDSPTAGQRAPSRQGNLGDSAECQSLGLRVVDPTALQAGVDLARQHCQINPMADVWQSVLKRPPNPRQLLRMFASDNLIELTELLLAADWKQITGFQLAKPLLEAEREPGQALLSEALDPYLGSLDGLRSQTSGVEQFTKEVTAPLRLSEAFPLSFASLDFGLGIDAIRSLGSAGDVTCQADPDGSMRIHAVPHLAPSPRRRQKGEGDCTSALSLQPAPDGPPGVLHAGDECEDSQSLLKELIRFHRSDEIPRDAREGMTKLNKWWELNQHRISLDQRLHFRLTLKMFIGSLLGLTTPTDGHQQLMNGLLVPQLVRPQHSPRERLDPRMYTSLELSKILNYNDSTIRRQAENAWTKADCLGPCPLRKGSEWYVVKAAEAGGGQKHGWKFQKRLTPDNH